MSCLFEIGVSMLRLTMACILCVNVGDVLQSHSVLGTCLRINISELPMLK